MSMSFQSFTILLMLMTGLLSAFTTRTIGELLDSNSEGLIKYVSINNQRCQARPTLVNTNSNETLNYPFTASVNKCGGSCNLIDDPYGQVCVPTKVKNMNVKVINVGGI